MSSLETAVRRLAGALDGLETRLSDRLSADDARETDAGALRRQARAARIHTEDATQELGEVIAAMKKLVADENDAAEKEKAAGHG